MVQLDVQFKFGKSSLRWRIIGRQGKNLVENLVE